MSDSLPPNRRPPRLRDDEPIALLVTFLVFGTILAWGISQGRERWDLSQLVSGWWSAVVPSESPSPQPTTSAIAPLVDNPQEAQANLEPTAPTSSTSSTVRDRPAAPPSQTPVSPSTETGTAVEPTPPSPQPSVLPTSPVTTLPASPSPLPSVSPSLQPQPVPAKPGGEIAFPDVPSTYWAAPFISGLAAKGIIGGFPDGTFKPNQPVTRAQYAVQLQKAFTKPDRQPPKRFTDVPPNSVWVIAVDKAVKANFMKGYPEGDFRPEQPVSRAEAVTSLVQGLGLPQPADPEAILKPYRDRNQIPIWARGRMAAAIQAQLFSGDPDTQLLNPNQPASRADIAALVYKGLQLNPNPPTP